MKNLSICDAETFIYEIFNKFQEVNPWYTYNQSIEEYWIDFKDLLIKKLRKIDPSNSRKIAVFGCSTDTFRRKIFPGYKANRIHEEQIAYLQRIDRTKQIFKKLGYEIHVTMPGYEADDLIASICKKEFENMDVINIFTFDTDLFQLINKKTNVVLFKEIGKRSDLYTNRNFYCKYYGYKPEHIPILKAICGDWTDGIPDVLTKKEANRIIRKYESVDNIFDNIKEIELTEPAVAYKLLEGKEIIYRNLEISTLKDDLLLE